MSASDDAAQAADPGCPACPPQDRLDLSPELAARSPRSLLDALLAAPDDADVAAALKQRAECETYLDCVPRCAVCVGQGDVRLDEAAVAVLHERTRAWHTLSTELLASLVACQARPAQLALLAGLAVRGCHCFRPGRPVGVHFAAWLASPASGAWRTDWELLRGVYSAYIVLVGVPDGVGACLTTPTPRWRRHWRSPGRTSSWRSARRRVLLRAAAHAHSTSSCTCLRSQPRGAQRRPRRNTQLQRTTARSARLWACWRGRRARS